MRIDHLYRPILLEYKRDITAKNWGEKLLKRYHEDTGQKPEITVGRKPGDNEAAVTTLLEHIEAMDPTKNKQYTEWLVRQYLKGQFLLEDGERVKGTLQNFESRKRRMENADIGKYTYHSLEDAVDAHAKKEDDEIDLDKADATDGDDPDAKIKDVKVLYKGPLGLLAIPLTKEASCEIGRGTKWCTAATGSGNYFHHYSKPDKPLIVWKDKNGEKYQFHFDTDQYMDAQDRAIPQSKLEDMRKNNPVLRKMFAKYEADFGTDPAKAIRYARRFGKLGPDVEKAIIKSGPENVYNYAVAINRRFPEGEDTLMKGPIRNTLDYVGKFLKGEGLSKENLKIIASSPVSAVGYAVQMKTPFPEGEDAIASDPTASAEYAKSVIKGRWKPGESAISRDAEATVSYAKDVLKGRFERGEDSLENNKTEAYRYVHYLRSLIPGSQYKDIEELPDMAPGWKK